MKNLIKAAFAVSAVIGFLSSGTLTASASDAGLMSYAKAPTTALTTDNAKSFKVADRRRFRKKSRRKFRRKKNNVGGKIAAGVAIGIAGIILSEAIRDGRRRDRNRYYYDDRSYAYGASHRLCRKWARRCDRGNRSSCRKWYRRCD